MFTRVQPWLLRWCLDTEMMSWYKYSAFSIDVQLHFQPRVSMVPVPMGNGLEYHLPFFCSFCSVPELVNWLGLWLDLRKRQAVVVLPRRSSVRVYSEKRGIIGRVETLHNTNQSIKGLVRQGLIHLLVSVGCERKRRNGRKLTPAIRRTFSCSDITVSRFFSRKPSTSYWTVSAKCWMQNAESPNLGLEKCVHFVHCLYNFEAHDLSSPLGIWKIGRHQYTTYVQFKEKCTFNLDTSAFLGTRCLVTLSVCSTSESNISKRGYSLYLGYQLCISFGWISRWVHINIKKTPPSCKIPLFIYGYKMQNWELKKRKKTLLVVHV